MSASDFPGEAGRRPAGRIVHCNTRAWCAHCAQQLGTMAALEPVRSTSIPRPRKNERTFFWELLSQVQHKSSLMRQSCKSGRNQAHSSCSAEETEAGDIIRTKSVILDFSGAAEHVPKVICSCPSCWKELLRHIRRDSLLAFQLYFGKPPQ